ncbi:hypothetical protein Enr10x_07760 [Gimesia panareensis]|uniref:Uncharacterized protein n=1 Tax=Gimesia panareensis TaxID=2527978 RepID=A0A517Q1G7_9PLAN|nr:hypothetical protein Enr10x_07760 [Gimesia panareensis]
MIIPHDKQKDRTSQTLSFIELQFGDRKLVGIPLWAFGGLTIFMTDYANVGRTVLNHLK